MNFSLEYIWLGLAQVFAYFVESSAGFGAVVICAPFNTGILGPKMGVPFGTILVTPLLIILAVKSRKNVSWKDLGKVLLACLPGLFLGQYLFYIISPDVAKIGIGTAVTVIALIKIYQHIICPLVLKKEVEEDKPDTTLAKIMRYTCLIIGGIVHGAFNIGGPLITVYTLEAVKEKTRYRNTMITLWATLDILNSINHFRNGAVTPELWNVLLFCWPFAAAGFIAGVFFLNKINRTTFLRFVYVVLLATGLNMLVRSLMAVM